MTSAAVNSSPASHSILPNLSSKKANMPSYLPLTALPNGLVSIPSSPSANDMNMKRDEAACRVAFAQWNIWRKSA